MYREICQKKKIKKNKYREENTDKTICKQRKTEQRR